MTRGRLLGAALAATLVAALLLAAQDADEGADEGDELLAAPARSARGADTRAAAAPRRAAPSLPEWPAAPASRPAAAWPADPSRLAAWMPPPAPAAAAATAPRPAAAASAAPQAPPFPYTLIGRIQDGEAVHALFASPQRTLGVRVQDLIDGQWRVEEVGAAGVTLTWLPGGVRQTLSFRAS